EQFKGFSHYGFPESHSASFALIAYASAYVKCYHPAAFAAALLNSQPMGFYAPHTIVEDAKRHGVVIRPIDVRHSGWDATLEQGALRIGLREVKGLQESHARALVEARGEAGFTDLGDLAGRVRIPRHAMERLARAGALDGLCGSRRQAVWDVQALGPSADDDLFRGVPMDRSPAPGRPLAEAERVAEDYRTTGLSLTRHPLALMRPFLDVRRVLTAAQRQGGRLPLPGGRDRHLQSRGVSGDLRARPRGAAQLGLPLRRGQGGAGVQRGERPGHPGDRAAAPVLADDRAAAVDAAGRDPRLTRARPAEKFREPRVQRARGRCSGTCGCAQVVSCLAPGYWSSRASPPALEHRPATSPRRPTRRSSCVASPAAR